MKVNSLKNRRKHQQIAGRVEEKKVIARIHRKNPNSKAN